MPDLRRVTPVAAFSDRGYSALDKTGVLAFRCRMRNILFLSLFTAASVLAQTESPSASPAAKAQDETTTPTSDGKNAPPFDTANMDTSVKPSDDFFMRLDDRHRPVADLLQH